MTTKTVLVGLTPRTDSLDTVTWAAEYAGRLSVPLRILLAGTANVGADVAARTVQNATGAVRDRFPHLSLSTVIAEDDLADVLLERCGDAHLVVVAGDPGRAGVAATVAGRAPCPVAAVSPGATWDADGRPVLVGADGTEHSEQALRWAFAEADRLGVGVRVVHCQPHGPASAVTARRRNSVFDLVALFTGRYPAIPVQLHTVSCAPAETLAWHSQFASMVVVGHRAHSLGGRTYRRLLRDAACPVVIAGPDTRLDTVVTKTGAAAFG